MTASKPTHVTSDNSGSRQGDSGVHTNPDAQLILDVLRRSGGRVCRERLRVETQLPLSDLTTLLQALEADGYVSIVPVYSGDRVALPGFADDGGQR